MVASTRNALRKFQDFSISISKLECREWKDVRCMISFKHIPSGRTFRRALHISKDDYLFTGAGIAGSRIDFVEQDPKLLAQFLLGRLRMKFYRRTNRTWGKKAQRVGICIDDVLLIDWDGEYEQFDTINTGVWSR